MITKEEKQEKIQTILSASANYEGADENRITMDKEDAKIIRELINGGFLRREFSNVGRNGMGFRLFITENGNKILISEEDEDEQTT